MTDSSKALPASTTKFSVIRSSFSKQFLRWKCHNCNKEGLVSHGSIQGLVEAYERHLKLNHGIDSEEEPF